MSWLYILTAFTKVSNSFSFLANSSKSFIHIRWLIFSCDSLSLYPPSYFLSMWLSGFITTTTNSNSDSASLWNIHLWIFTSAKLLLTAVNSTLQYSLVLSINFLILSDILYILRHCKIQLLYSHIVHGNIVNNNDERTNFFRKIYLSHFIHERVIKRLRKGWYRLCYELETEQTAT